MSKGKVRPLRRHLRTLIGEMSVRNKPELLFSKPSLSNVLDQNFHKAKQLVDDLPEQEFMASTDNDIFEHIFSQTQITPLELFENKKERQIREMKIGGDGPWDGEPVPGTEIVVKIPFTGDSFLWEWQPHELSLNPPRANIFADKDRISGQIEIIISGPSAIIEGDAVKQELKRRMDAINYSLAIVRQDVERHNQKLANHIRGCIAIRRQILRKHEAIARTLDIPLTVC